MEQEKDKQQADKQVNFRRLIEVMAKEGFGVCDIHLEEEHDPSLRQDNKFTGSVIIKTFPMGHYVLTG
jgi:hypothetical protein